MFKVVPDQLRVSQGWVRCGQCDEVFDANAHMRNVLQEPVAESAAAPATEPETPPNPVEHQAHAAADAVAPVAPDPVLEPEPETPLEPASYDWNGVLDDAPAPPEAVQDSFLEKSPQELLAASHSVDRNEPALAQDTASSSQADESIWVTPDHAAPVSFMAAKPQARSKAARGWWAAAGALLSLALVTQFVLHERDRLAATQPALKPALVAMCEVLSCQVNALRQIESIVIDSSTFSKVQPDVYKLSVTLKNNALVEVAKPSLELTLTDSQDQALIRKVIAPAELGDKAAVMAPADELSWTIPLSIKQAKGDLPIAGYRVLAFYP